MAIHPHHVVFDLRLESVRGCGVVNPLKRDELVLIERGKILDGRGPEITSGAFDPENIHVLTTQRIFFDRLRGSISSSGIRDAEVASQNIGAKNEALDGAHLGDLFVVPMIIYVAVVGWIK